MGLASISTGAVATAAVILIGVVSCAPPPGTDPTPPAGTSSSTPTGEPTSPPPDSGTPATVPVYYVGTVGSRLVLYREFHDVAVANGSVTARITAALGQMLSVDALDPDYASHWPSTATVRDVRVESGIAVVDLGGVVTNNVGAETEALTIEQLVWTVTAVAADAGTPVQGVRLLVDGQSRSELWGHVGIGGVLRRGESTNVLAPVWLIAPQHGDAVGRDVRVHIAGTVWEATAHLTVRAANGTVVHDDFVMLNRGAPERGEAYVNLTLAPGRYTLEAFFYSAEDGSVQGMDNHEIIVS